MLQLFAVLILHLKVN